ncbi:MAG TPA: hypothetical protein VI197_21960 [Polyangiaceae bacterium]
MPSLEAARGVSPRTWLGPIRLDRVEFAPDSTVYLHAYSDCDAGVGVKLACEPGAHVSTRLLDRAGKALRLNRPGAREHRTARSADLWSPDACHYFFVEITNHARSPAHCNLVVWAIHYGP